MPGRLLFVFAKEPRAGEVKTRMCPPLTDVQAARCQAAFVGDVLARLRGAAGARTVLAAAPAADAPFLVRTAAELGVELAWQGAGHLGQRLEEMLEGALQQGASAAVVGADSPDLPLDTLPAAFAHAEAGDVALGPCDDGGFYLLACARRVPALSAIDPPWGSARVLESTMTHIERSGSSLRLLPWWYDVDDFAGLARLALRMRVARARGEDSGLPRCERLLEELAHEGIGI